MAAHRSSAAFAVLLAAGCGRIGYDAILSSERDGAMQTQDGSAPPRDADVDSGFSDAALPDARADPLRITQLIWWDAIRNVPLGPFVEGQPFDLYDPTMVPYGISLEAQVATTPGSVLFSLESHLQTETTAPYFLFGDSSPDSPHPWLPRLWPLRLMVTAYSGPSGTGTAGPPYAVDLNFNYSYVGTVEIDGSVLLDAADDREIGPLNNLDVVDLGALGVAAINIRIDLIPANTGSVVMTMTPTAPPAWEGSTGIESWAPHTVTSDAFGVTQGPWTPAPGTYTLLATPYSGLYGQGTPGTTVNLQFDVQ